LSVGILDALKSIHDNGVIHRDISTDNIMVHNEKI